MDITSVSGASAFQQLKIGNNVATSVAAKVLDSQRTEAAVLKLLDAASVPASSGSSRRGVDVRA